VGENNLNSVAKNDVAEMQAQVEANTHMLYFFAIDFATVVPPGILYVLCFFFAIVRSNRGGGAGAGVGVRLGAGAGGNGDPNALGKRFDKAGKLTTPGGIVDFSDNFIHTYLRSTHWDTEAKRLKRLGYLKQKGEEIATALLCANGGQPSIMELVFKKQTDFIKVIKDNYEGCTYTGRLHAAKVRHPRRYRYSSAQIGWIGLRWQ